MLALLGAAAAQRREVTVPTAVIAEWWRGRSNARERILRSDPFTIEPLSSELAKLAGEAMAATPGATIVDAIVMASAASRSDIVYTSDFDDLDALSAFFPAVRVLAV